MKKLMLILSVLFIATTFQVRHLNAGVDEYIYGAARIGSEIGLYIAPIVTGMAFLGNKFMSAVHEEIPDRGNSILLKGTASFVILLLLRYILEEKYNKASGKPADSVEPRTFRTE